MLEAITPVILTFNEENNIDRVLARLAWAKDIVVVDSGSTDGTLGILHADPRVRTFHRPFDVLARQWTYAIENTGIGTEWVLALDADYIATDQLIEEISVLVPPPEVAGYRVQFRYCVKGQALWSSLYPPVTVLYRHTLARYEQDGHAQRVRLDGRIEKLKGMMHHDDRKPFESWLRAQRRYAAEEGRKLLSTPWRELGWSDRLRRLVFFAPFVVAGYCLFAKGCLLQGRAGLVYAGQRTLAEFFIAKALLSSLVFGDRCA